MNNFVKLHFPINTFMSIKNPFFCAKLKHRKNELMTSLSIKNVLGVYPSGVNVWIESTSVKACYDKRLQLR